jgi:hypothetical protein
MANSVDRSIAYAEHVPNGLLVVFVDGESAVYTANFLRDKLAEMKSAASTLPPLDSSPAPNRRKESSGDS